MTLTINVESGYINVQDYKSGNNPTLKDVIILDKKAFLEERDKVREWLGIKINKINSPDIPWQFDKEKDRWVRTNKK